VPEEIPLFETRAGCAGLYLWKAAGGRRVRSPEEESEEVRKLRALGYLH
jgi:hypothetical protein